MEKNNNLIITSIVIGTGFFFTRGDETEKIFLILDYLFLIFLFKITFFSKVNNLPYIKSNFVFLRILIIFFGAIAIDSIAYWTNDPYGIEFEASIVLALLFVLLMYILNWFNNFLTH